MSKSNNKNNTLFVVLMFYSFTLLLNPLLINDLYANTNKNSHLIDEDHLDEDEDDVSDHGQPCPKIRKISPAPKEFINKNGEFTVNVALVENGIPILGVVSAPAINETFIGFANEAYKVINKEHRKITSRKQSTDHCLVTVSKSHKSEKDQLFIDLCHKEFGSIEELPTGSSLKLCRVAEGKADIYSRLGPTYQWDIAAGQAVAVAAGGVVSDLSGRPLRYEFKSSTKNPQFFCAGDNSFSWKDVFLKLV